jgi:hypothetical protein
MSKMRRELAEAFWGKIPQFVFRAPDTDLEHDIEREDQIIREDQDADLEVYDYTAWADFYGVE